MTPEEAGAIIDYCKDHGLGLDLIAVRLGVSPLYASRLSKKNYWPKGTIPKRAALGLERIYAELSPEPQRKEIIASADQLKSGDVYYIHSARTVLEFTDPHIRSAILRCAARDVQVHYIFPDIKRIFDGYGRASLDLAEIVPLDLRERYRLLMRVFLSEAEKSGICSPAKLKKNVFFKEHANGFLFSPWNKIIYFQIKRGSALKSTVIQEHHSLGPIERSESSTLNWSCTGPEADRIGKILTAADYKVLNWSK